MMLRHRYLLSAASLGALLLLLIGAGRISQATRPGIQPKPLISALNPDQVLAGSPGFTLTVNGAFFVPKSVVQWNGEARPTTVVSDGVLRAEIPSGDVAAGRTVAVTVLNPIFLSEYPGVSNVLAFHVVPTSSF
jgi:hypothetical protein